MFDYYQPKEREPVDYRGFIIGATIVVPVFGLITFLANADVGITVSIVLGMITLAITLHWDSRKHVWFWATVAMIFALHVPLLLWVRWPQGKVPVRLLGILDFFIVVVILELAERLFSKDWRNNPITIKIPDQGK